MAPRFAKVATFGINPFSPYYLYLWFAIPLYLSISFLVTSSTEEWLASLFFFFVIFLVPFLIVVSKPWKVEIDDHSVRLWALGAGCIQYSFDSYDFQFERQIYHMGKAYDFQFEPPILHFGRKPGWCEECSIISRDSGIKVRVLTQYCFRNPDDLKKQLLARQEAFWSRRQPQPPRLSPPSA